LLFRASFIVLVNRLVAFCLLLSFSLPGHAVRFSVAAGPPFVLIQVGHGVLSAYGLLGPPVSQVDEVSFPLPPGVQFGDGTPIVGTPVSPIAFLGYSGSNQSNYIVTMNSSGGLVNGNGDVILFSELSWTTQDGDIPSGQFDNSANQVLQQYNRRGNRARGVVDYLTFSYANTSTYPAGSYSGRVTYTITNL
jgi:hypothetical protein